MSGKKNKELSENAVLILKLLSNRDINDGGTIHFILFLGMTQDKKFARLKKKEYAFLRSIYGPFSESILNNSKSLISEELIAVEASELRLTQKGKEILENRWERISKTTKGIATLIDAIAAKWRRKRKGDFVLRIRKAVFKTREFQQTELGAYFRFVS
jgi:hypothetical protein